ncbi:unnamed protein product [Cuscuta campestris]|uniref:Uncharacterized protein n=1 Tax=Cuscuta campestris TaxID=132261 RepID=A0A484NKJ4_9ASTE|nr:unnamed protein product [Cuscuta campestris]
MMRGLQGGYGGGGVAGEVVAGDIICISSIDQKGPYRRSVNLDLNHLTLPRRVDLTLPSVASNLYDAILFFLFVSGFLIIYSIHSQLRLHH